MRAWGRPGRGQGAGKMPKDITMFHENIWLCWPGIHRSSAGPTEDPLALLQGCRPTFSPERATPPASKPLGPLFSGILSFDVGFLAEAGGPAGSQRRTPRAAGSVLPTSDGPSRGPSAGGSHSGPRRARAGTPQLRTAPVRQNPRKGFQLASPRPQSSWRSQSSSWPAVPVLLPPPTEPVLPVRPGEPRCGPAVSQQLPWQQRASVDL